MDTEDNPPRMFDTSLADEKEEEARTSPTRRGQKR
jgi:hypothetical protein